MDEAPLLLLRLTGDPARDVGGLAAEFGRLPEEGREAVRGLCEAEVSSTGLMVAVEQCAADADALPPGTSLDELRFLARIVDCNLFKVDLDSSASPAAVAASLVSAGAPTLQGEDEEEEEQEGVVCAVYALASRCNHSCAPSAAAQFQGDGSIRLRTLRDVAVGEELTVSYLDDAGLVQCTANRRWRLQSSWNFACACARCASLVDSARAFRCPGCGAGAVLAGAGPEQAGGGLQGSRCPSCGEAVGPEDAASALACEQAALMALQFCDLAPQATDMAKLDRQLAEAAERLAPSHWAMGSLHDVALRLLLKAGALDRALPHLEAKLLCLDAAELGMGARDREMLTQLRRMLSAGESDAADARTD